MVLLLLFLLTYDKFVCMLSGDTKAALILKCILMKYFAESEGGEYQNLFFLKK